jgi:hypothetical protein
VHFLASVSCRHESCMKHSILSMLSTRCCCCCLLLLLPPLLLLFCR